MVESQRGSGMSDFPPIGDELRPRAKLKRHADGTASDADIEASSRLIGEKWGASTSIPQEASPSPPLAPVVSIRGYFPDYLDRELSMKAAERGVTKTFLLWRLLPGLAIALMKPILCRIGGSDPKKNSRSGNYSSRQRCIKAHSIPTIAGRGRYMVPVVMPSRCISPFSWRRTNNDEPKLRTLPAAA